MNEYQALINELEDLVEEQQQLIEWHILDLQVGLIPQYQDIIQRLQNLSEPSQARSLREDEQPLVLEEPETSVSATFNDLPARFKVTIEDEDPIELSTAQDTFIEAITKLGIENVMKVDRGRRVVSTEPFAYPRCVQVDQFYININSGNARKKAVLERFAKALNVELNVEILTG